MFLLGKEHVQLAKTQYFSIITDKWEIILVYPSSLRGCKLFRAGILPFQLYSLRCLHNAQHRYLATVHGIQKWPE